jgi:transcriptional regulator with PAS, ATPase and Fis domain
MADGGMLFLDEIGDMLAKKLIRADLFYRLNICSTRPLQHSETRTALRERQTAGDDRSRHAKRVTRAGQDARRHLLLGPSTT